MKNKTRYKDPVKESLAFWPWPYMRRNLGGVREYECPHGIGHGGIHACDGCCRHSSFPGNRK